MADFISTIYQLSKLVLLNDQFYNNSHRIDFLQYLLRKEYLFEEDIKTI